MMCYNTLADELVRACCLAACCCCWFRCSFRTSSCSTGVWSPSLSCVAAEAGSPSAGAVLLMVVHFCSFFFFGALVVQ